MNNIIVGFVAIIAVINGVPQYTWEDLIKNKEPLPPDTRQTDMEFSGQHLEPAVTDYINQRLLMIPSSESNNERKEQQTSRILSSLNDSKSMEYYRHENRNIDEDFVAPMIREDTRLKHDIQKILLNFLSGQQSFDEQAVIQENSKKHLIKTILEELPRYGIQSNYYDNEHGPRFMTTAPKMEHLPKQVQQQRVAMDYGKLYADMDKSLIRITDLIDLVHSETVALRNRETNTFHSMETMSNSQEIIQNQTNVEQNRMITTNLEEPTDRHVSYENNHEQIQNQKHQNKTIENKMGAKFNNANNGLVNNGQMMDTICRN